MRVILLKPVQNLGSFGEVVNVKKGYARNFLIPQQLAKLATKENLADIEKRRKELEIENQKLQKAAEENSQILSDLQVFLIHQASEDGKLYGTVNPKDVCEYVKEKFAVQLEKSQVRLPGKIKDLGVYSFHLDLHLELSIECKLVISRTEQEAKQLLEDHNAPKKTEKNISEDQAEDYQ